MQWFIEMKKEEEEDDAFNKTIVQRSIASKWKLKRHWNTKKLMISSWKKVNETIHFVDDFLKKAEEVSMFLPNISSMRNSIDIKEASLIDPKSKNYEKKL